MKKTILFIIAFSILAIVKTDAQSTSAGAFGNDYGGVKYLGYRTAFPGNLDFHTANAGGAPLMRLQNSNGFLGIGLTSPGYRLDVQDDININPNSGLAYYRIAGNSVLHVYGTLNTCVGENNGLGLSTGTSNSFLGNSAGTSNTSGSQNVFLGMSAGSANISNDDNTFVGTYAGQNSTANENTFIGSYAGSTNTTGSNNTFTGFKSGWVNTSGYRNSFLGNQTGYSNTTGRQNTFTGYQAGYTNTSGVQNTFTGDKSGELNTTGSYNSFYGDLSGNTNTTGQQNSFVGHHAGANNTTGSYNCYMGSHTAFAGVNSTGWRNNYIGAEAGPQERTGNDHQFMGFRAGWNNIAGSRNVLIGTKSGDTLTDDDNVFIGYRSGFYQITGNYNTYIGTNCADNSNVTGFTNAAAFGYNAVPRNSNHMILGDNNVNVGIGLSNDATGPRDKLEIKGAAGTSGLQFTQINAGTTPTANPGAGVLALDANGKVIYVPDVASSGAIQTCSTNLPIANDLEIDMGTTSTKNFIFRDYNSNATSKVGIGINSCSPSAKLHVYQQSGATNTIGTLLENNDAATSSNDVIALKVLESATSTSGRRIAGWFEVDRAGVCTTPKFSIYVPDCSGYISLGYSTPTVAGSSLLSVNGDITAAGVMFATGFTVVSDNRYKKNIISIRKDSALAKVRALNGVYYDWDIVNNPGHNFEASHQVGFIAQQVASILPEAVRIDSNGYYGVEYMKIIPLLTNAINQLDSLNTVKDATISNLENRLTALEQIVNGCCNMNGGEGGMRSNPNNNNFRGNVTQTEIELVNTNTIILNQNVPNPFEEKTLIGYYIPESVKEAQILFYNELGVVLKTVDIREKGKGQVTVYASNLSSGIYTYTLLADGKVIDTKKMVCTK